MNGTLKLSKPIKINNKKVAEMTYDTDAIDSMLFCAAESKKQQANTSKVNLSGAAELDYSFHLYLGFAAIIALNPEYDFTDLERITGHDVMEVMKIGRNFIIASEDAQDETSEEESETTLAPSTLQ